MNEFQTIVGGFIELMDKLGKSVDLEKMKVSLLCV
jgi:hypothetical protein